MAEGASAISRAGQIANAPECVIVILGRLLFVLIFVMSSAGLFTKQTIGFAQSQGVPQASISVPLAGMLPFVGGLSILVGYRAKFGAWLIVLFLVPVTLMMHKFWGVSDANAAQQQMISFLKNAAMLGGALLITQFGAGPLSLEARKLR